MERNVYEFEDPHGVGDMLEAVISDAGVNFRIDEPWAGDTNSGFGREASLLIPPDEAVKLARMILKVYAPRGDSE